MDYYGVTGIQGVKIIAHIDVNVGSFEGTPADCPPETLHETEANLNHVNISPKTHKP